MSAVAPGLNVNALPRGFEVSVRAAASPGGALALLGLGMVVACVGAGLAAVVALDSAEVAVVAVIPAALGGAMTLGVLAIRRVRRNAGVGRLRMDGERVVFAGLEGPVDAVLSDIKGVDVVPIGLAVRFRDGTAAHFPLPKVPPEGRSWLRDRLRESVDRHGLPADVPDAMKGLARREGRAKEPF